MKVLDIYITEICNLNCEYCYVDLKKKEYDGFEYKSFIRRVDLLKFDIIKFLGGEPLLKFEDIKKIIIGILNKKSEIKFSVITNGLLIDNDKLKFFRINNTSLTISVHEKGIKKILNKIFLLNLYKYKDIIGFSFLYNFKHIKFSTIVFILLVKIGFRNFSFTPITDIGWNDNRLRNLKKELYIIKGIIKKNKTIKIAGTEENYIKLIDIDNFCTKEQVDKKGIKKLCTRFNNENILENKNNVKKIHNLFDKYNSCNSCKDKWFCTCPIGWYLDKIDIKNKKQIIETFHSLNKVFIDFHKDIVKIKEINNFFTENINEIRFNITEQCNLRCNYCYLKFSNNKLDFKKAQNIVNFLLLQEGKYKTISFLGGEPLLEYNLMKQIVIYTNKLSNNLGKIIKYKIATNGLLLNDEKIKFFKKNSFEVHISLNGMKDINDKTRDNSYNLLLEKIKLLDNKEDYIILMVIFPYNIFNIKKNILHIKSKGFNNISFEIYLGDKYQWDNIKYLQIEKQFISLKESGYFSDLIIMNILNSKNKYLDISTDGKINDNSLIFFNKKIDFTPKKELDKIITKIFND